MFRRFALLVLLLASPAQAGFLSDIAKYLQELLAGGEDCDQWCMSEAEHKGQEWLTKFDFDKNFKMNRSEYGSMVEKLWLSNSTDENDKQYMIFVNTFTSDPMVGVPLEQFKLIFTTKPWRQAMAAHEKEDL
mmetsp:Transcript_31175/g.63057  ORF Transcript_31175/g.63057 Transcript_31175/m.63057 type:complete len:132 (+) Transcript_31175:92-487(+)